MRINVNFRKDKLFIWSLICENPRYSCLLSDCGIAEFTFEETSD